MWKKFWEHNKKTSLQNINRRFKKIKRESATNMRQSSTVKYFQLGGKKRGILLLENNIWDIKNKSSGTKLQENLMLKMKRKNK